MDRTGLAFAKWKGNVATPNVSMTAEMVKCRRGGSRL
jgi:flagellar basal body rod protein FlgC